MKDVNLAVRDMASQADESLMPDPQTLRQHVAPASRRRRRMRAGVWVAAAAAVVLTLGVGVPALRTDHTASAPTSGGPPTGGLTTLAADPLLSDVAGLPLRTGVPPGNLSPCVSSPLTWGAVESSGASYGRPGGHVVFNEFVLRFDSVAAAHRAVVAAWHEFARCPTSPEVLTDPLVRPPPLPDSGFSEWFSNERARFATQRHQGQPVAMYALRVARHANVVVVLEDIGEPDDRAEVVLSEALRKATGHPSPIWSKG